MDHEETIIDQYAFLMKQEVIDSEDDDDENEEKFSFEIEDEKYRHFCNFINHVIKRGDTTRRPTKAENTN